MSPSECVEGWQNTALPFIRRKLELNPQGGTFENSAQAIEAAKTKFQETLDGARRYHATHTSESPELHHATMAHMFEIIGILPLDAVRIVDEIILDNT